LRIGVCWKLCFFGDLDLASWTLYDD